MTTLILGAILFVGVTWLHARWFPLRVCGRCRGTGELSSSGVFRRVCPRCQGTRRVRRFLAPRP